MATATWWATRAPWPLSPANRKHNPARGKVIDCEAHHACAEFDGRCPDEWGSNAVGVEPPIVLVDRPPHDEIAQAGHDAGADRLVAARGRDTLLGGACSTVLHESRADIKQAQAESDDRGPGLAGDQAAHAFR